VLAGASDRRLAFGQRDLLEQGFGLRPHVLEELLDGRGDRRLALLGVVGRVRFVGKLDQLFQRIDVAEGGLFGHVVAIENVLVDFAIRIDEPVGAHGRERLRFVAVGSTYDGERTLLEVQHLSAGMRFIVGVGIVAGLFATETEDDLVAANVVPECLLVICPEPFVEPGQKTGITVYTGMRNRTDCRNVNATACAIVRLERIGDVGREFVRCNNIHEMSLRFAGLRDKPGHA